jgi:hypothetical protein
MASCIRNKDESSPRLLSVCASPARNDGLRIHNMRILYSICRLLDYFHLAGVRIYFYCCFFSGNGVAGNLISFRSATGFNLFPERFCWALYAASPTKTLAKNGNGMVHLSCGGYSSVRICSPCAHECSSKAKFICCHQYWSTFYIDTVANFNIFRHTFCNFSFLSTFLSSNSTYFDPC